MLSIWRLIFSIPLFLLFAVDYSAPKQYDLVIIGLGSAGLSAINRASSYPISIAVIEKGPIGGTCVHAGCVPKKFLWNAAIMAQSKDQLFSSYGLLSSPNKDHFSDEYHFEMGKNRASRLEYIGKIEKSYHNLFATMKQTDIFLGFQLEEIVPTTVGHVLRAVRPRDGASLSIKGKKIVLAMGGHPKLPPAPLASKGITSDQVWAMDFIPETAVIVGSGYIAFEFATILKNLGSKRVIIVVKGERGLKSMDAEIIHFFQQDLSSRQGIEILFNAKLISADTSVLYSDSKYSALVTIATENDDPVNIDADLLLWAIGRSPNSHIKGIPQNTIEEETGLFIVNKETFETKIPGIYAIGDIIEGSHLTPVAIAQGKSLVDQLFNKGAPFDTEIPIPTVLFSIPPLASVGYSEEAARERFGSENVQTVVKKFIPMIFSKVIKSGFSSHYSIFKIVCVGPDEKVVGIHLFGPNVDEILQGFSVAISTGVLTKKMLEMAIPIHPTVAEELVLM